MLEIGAVFMRTETELILKSRRVVPGTLLEGGWGLIGYFIGSATVGSSIWGGVLAAPTIGIVIGRVSRPLEASSRRLQILASTHRYMHLSPAAIESAIRLLERPVSENFRGDVRETGERLETALLDRPRGRVAPAAGRCLHTSVTSVAEEQLSQMRRGVR
jgi:hypothetical protein